MADELAGFDGPAADQAAIRALHDSYADAVNLGDAAAWGALWAEDAAWDLMGLRMKGRAGRGKPPAWPLRRCVCKVRRPVAVRRAPVQPEEALMPIVITGEVDLHPGHRDAALAGAKGLIDEALAEPGCRHYNRAADPHDPGRIHVFEERDTADELAAHLVAPSCFGMLGHLSTFGIAAAMTRKYRVDLIEPVYGADGVATARFQGEAA